ncbi:MAG: hypothetical protein IJ849_07035 [Selenomonadaceae bacterium]|nr:hypothetical protein [Selenomonadaceae bacterium]
MLYINRMSLIALIVLVGMLSMFGLAEVAGAADQPSCVVMKFSNDTRFKKTDADAVLSDLVVEKMIASGKFQMKETRPLTAETEALLYDENARMKQGMREVMQGGSFTTLFEGPGFNSVEAYSIASAERGQLVSPAIVKKIGQDHQVDYLVQGTIDYIGTSKKSNEDFSTGKMTVRCTLRLIQANTGKVIWIKSLDASDTNTSMKVSFFTIGSSKLDMNLYSKMLDKAAKKIVEKLITDLDAGSLLAEA